MLLVNHGQETFTVTPGMRIAQLVVAAVEHVIWSVCEALPETARADGGFGHTGH